MTEYKVIYRADKQSEGAEAIKWEPGCPLEIEAIQVSRDTGTGTAFLQGRLRNISDRIALSFKATVTVEYEDGNTEDVEFNPLDADIAVGASYLLGAKKLNRGDVMNASGKMESVKFADDTWMSSVEPKTVPKPSPIGLSDEAVAERYTEVWASDKNPTFSAYEAKAAAANHLEKHEGWWLCPCGQVNVGRDTCVTCGASLEVLGNPDAENDEALANAAKARAEKEAKDRAEADKKHAEKVKRAKQIGIPAAIVCVIVIIIISIILWLTVFHPKAEYDSALNLYDSGNYSEAYEKFTALGDYEQANDWANKSLAEDLYENGDLTGSLQSFEKVDNSEIYVQRVLESMAEYIEEHPTKDDSKTLDYLETLRRYNFEGSDLLLGLIYPWSYEFSLTSSKAFEANNEQWTTVSELQPKEGIGYSDSGVLLIRAKCENPDGCRDLRLSWETRSAGSVFEDENGKWSKGGQTGNRDESYEVKIWGDGKIYSFPFPDMYCDAWKVTVADPITNEILYTGEIYQQ